MKFSSLSTAGKTSGAFYKLIQRQRPALIPRQNPFLHPGLEAWRRDFKTAEPIDLISLSRRIFESPLRTDLMHRVVRWHRNGLRAGTASSKARGEVAGSSRKIRPQKGTGAARAGSNRAPHRRGGGACFGPKPRDYSFTIPPKLRHLALRSSLSARWRQDQLAIVKDDTIALDNHKTCSLASICQRYTAKKLLFLDSQPLEVNMLLASKSLPHQFAFFDVTSAKFNAFHVLNCQHIVMTERAAAYLAEKLY